MYNDIYTNTQAQESTHNTPPAELSPAPSAVNAAKLPADIFKRWTAYIDGAERTKATYTANIKRFAEWLQVNGITAPSRADIIKIPAAEGRQRRLFQNDCSLRSDVPPGQGSGCKEPDRRVG